MTTILRSHDLSCPSCIARIEKALARVEGVERADVRFHSGKIEIEHDPERATVETLVQAVRAAGYETKVSRF